MLKDILKKEKTYIYLFFIVFVSVTITKFLTIKYSGPQLSDDFFEYYQYAMNILHGNFVSPDAKRTPGYPLFIVLSYLVFGIHNNSIAYLQVVTGFFSLYLFYVIQIGLGIKNRLIYINLIFFLMGPLSYLELSLYSETVGVVFFLLFFRSMQVYIQNKGKWYAALTLAAALLLILTRPQYIIPLIFVNIFLYRKEYKRYSIVFSSAILLFVLLYSWFNYLGNNYFGISSHVGYTLTNHTSTFFESARELNPEFVDYFVKTRDAFITHKEYYFAVYSTADTFIAAGKYNFVTMSKELTRLNIYLITKHPFEYIRSVIKALILSFDYEGHYSQKGYKFRMFPFVNLFVLVVGFYFLLFSSNNSVFTNYIRFTVFITVISAAFLDIGENYRHIVPVMAFCIIFFTAGTTQIFNKISLEKVQELS